MILKKTWVSRLVFVLICLGVFTILRLGWLYLFYPVDQTNAVNGQMIINSDYLDQNQLLYLTGEWEVRDVENQMLSTENDTALTTEVAMATLNIAFNAPIDSKELMLYIPNSPYKTTVFMNGVQIGESEKQSRHSYDGYTVPFSIEKDFIFLEIKAEGEKLQFPFTDKAVVFSSQEGMTNRIHLNEGIRVAVFVTLLMNIIYSLVFFFFFNRSKLALVYAAAYLCLFLDMFYKIALPYFSWMQLSYNIEARLPMLSIFGTAFCLILMGKMIIQPLKINYMNKIIWIYIVAFLSIFIVPIQMVNYLSLTLLGLHILSVFFVYSSVWRKNQITDKELLYLFFSFSAGISGVLWTGIKAKVYFGIPSYPVDYLAIELGLAIFWLNRYHMSNQKVKNLVDELRLADQMKEEFLQNSSERLYNPLNKLMVMIEELPSVDRSKVSRDNISKMEQIAKGMYFTLNDVLDYTRLKEGKIFCEQKPVNIQAILYYIKDLLDHLLPQNQMNIVLEMPKRLPFVYGDEKRLIQVFFNLLQYSLSATYSGTINIKCSVHGNRLMVEITDESSHKKDMFQDVKKISLDVCRQLIELQGGQLKVDPLCVVVELVASQDEYSVDHFLENDSSNGDKIYQASILIFAERMQDLDMLQTVFSSEPYYIKIAKTTDDIQSLLLQQPWDLVIIDSILSDHSGYRLIKLIRKQFTLVELPILCMVVKVNALEASNCFTIGANDFITKPLQPVMLKNRVRALITTKQMVENKLQLEIALLQAQIEPHFLFNTLNSIASLSEIDTEKMVRLLNEFGEYLSSSFNKRMMKRLVPLKDELQVVKSYTYIEQQRFEPLLKVKWEIEDLFDIPIPPFSLQTIVENAIRHGINKKNDSGTVVIQICKKENEVFVVVKDDGIGIEKEIVDHLLEQSDQRGIGLVNTNERLKRSFGVGLQIESEIGKGTTVMMRIPIK